MRLKIMKVVIFAGGYGSRLGSITETTPKPMVKIGGKPIIWHIMKIYSHYGIKEFVLCLGYKQDVIKEYFHNFNFLSSDFEIRLGGEKIKVLNHHDEIDWKITLVDTGLNTLRGGRLKRVEKYLKGSVHMMTYGDGVADVDLKKLLMFHKSHKKILTVTGVYPPSRFGEISEENSKVISFKEKPQVKSGVINGGFFVFDKRIFKYLKDDEKCDLEKQVFEKLVSKGEVMVYRHLKNWACVDTERDLKYLNEVWETGNAFWKVWK